MKLASEKIKDLLLDGNEYEIQELHDIISQAEKEIEDADGGDFIIFRGKKYEVKKATYDVIRATKKTLIFQRYTRELYNMIQEIEGKRKSSISLWKFIPFLYSFVDMIDNYRYRQSWNNLCKLTFADWKDFELGGLTQGEVERVMRVFFRFQAGLFLAGQDGARKSSKDI